MAAENNAVTVLGSGTTADIVALAILPRRAAGAAVVLVWKPTTAIAIVLAILRTTAAIPAVAALATSSSLAHCRCWVLKLRRCWNWIDVEL
ncbi:hypothetical protein B0T18DRAFT_403876 [Schizothecium vesticola]|uniref:Uncharacterized protein n=1 Tax=Schizothecium vesticola TaxID=314040 RepID=A0AA40F6P6_9PEZI|nr:hypothetical protein B0T18DRAFT_403876 [Schizothecium vesticola]